MKIYCSICDKVQPVNIDNCRDAKTNEPFQDIVCAECDLVIASGTDIAQQAEQAEPVAMRYDFDGYGWKYIDSGSGSDWMTRIKGAEPLYTHPQERKPLTDEEILTYRHMNIKDIEYMWKKATNQNTHDTNWYDPMVVEFAKLVAQHQRKWVGLTDDQKDAARYRAFLDSGYPVNFMGVEFDSKAALDSEIDDYIKEKNT